MSKKKHRRNQDRKKVKHGSEVTFPIVSTVQNKCNFKAKNKNKVKINVNNCKGLKLSEDSQSSSKFKKEANITSIKSHVSNLQKKNKLQGNMTISDENCNIKVKNPETNTKGNRDRLTGDKNSGPKSHKKALGSTRGSKKQNVPNLADITHKKCTGNNNWMNFLKGQDVHVPETCCSTVASKEASCQNPGNRKKRKKQITKVLALDCEMVGVGEQGRDNMLARISIVNWFGECIYDKFVQAREKVIDYRTPVSGVRPENLLKGEKFETVQKEVAEILKNKIIVGHSLKSDFDVLFISHPRGMVRDTSKYLREPGKGTPSLKKLAAQFLGVKIQEGEHNSVQDARAAVQLYNMFRKEWESKKSGTHY